MSLFEALRESHEIQRGLFRRLSRTGGLAQRELLFIQLKIELQAHAAAEERFLYVPMLMTDSGLNSSRHALSEHHDIEELTEDLSVRDKGSQEWMDTLGELSHKVHHHLREEEHKFFKVGGRLLPDGKKETLARRYRSDLLRMRRKYAGEFQLVTVGGDGLLAPNH